MYGSLTCRNGHSWQPGPTPALLGEDRCPKCGAPTRSPLHPGPGPWIILGLFEVNLLWAGVACYLYWDRLGALVPLGAAVALWGVAGRLVARNACIRRLEAVCEAQGFTFTGELSPARLKALGAFDVLDWRRSPSAYHMMEGHREGCAVALLELRHSTLRRNMAASRPVPCPAPSPELRHSTDDTNEATGRRTVVIVGRGFPAPQPGRDFARHFRAPRPAASAIQEAPPVLADLPADGPAFRLEPLGPGDWLWQRFRGRDTPFRDHPAFSKRYRLDGPCDEVVRRALRPEVLDVFADHPGWSVEVLGGRLLAHRKGPCDPADCPRLIAEAVAMYRAHTNAWAAPAASGPCAIQEALP